MESTMGKGQLMELRSVVPAASDTNVTRPTVLQWPRVSMLHKSGNCIICSQTLNIITSGSTALLCFRFNVYWHLFDVHKEMEAILKSWSTYHYIWKLCCIIRKSSLLVVPCLGRADFVSEYDDLVSYDDGNYQTKRNSF